ncbi:MAG: hypothetical protein QF535_05285 [Anaerolineales bacterium]|nr:hypothetical protein [Anaerolineales bacterium]
MANVRLMLDYILAADLFVMTLLLAHLSWHCMKWRNELPVIAESATGTTAEIIEIMNEGGAILTDIADLLEGSSNHSPAPQTGMPNIPELLLNALMNKTVMPILDGEAQNQDGQIYEAEQQTQTEQVQVGGEHTGSGDRPNDG